MFFKSPDVQIMADHVRFEPGIHDLTADDAQATQSAIDHGDPWANEWNEAVTTRLATYRPTILGIDSLVPYGLKKDGEDTKFEMKRFVWQALPDRPSMINGTDEIFVVSGDHTYATNGLAVGASTFDRTIAEVGGAATIFIGGSVVGSLIDSFARSYMQQVRGYDNVTGIFDKEKAQAVSRRTFFQKAIAVAAVVTYGCDRTASVYSPWPTLTRILDEIEDRTISPFRFNSLIGDDQDMIDGRTALVIQKVMSAMIQLDMTEQEGAIVMGNGHIDSAEDSIYNEGARLERIEKLAKIMYDAAKRGVHYYADEATHHTSAKDRIEGINQTHPKYHVYKVLEPDDKAFEKDSKKEIERIVLFEGEFVDKAIVKLLK